MYDTVPNLNLWHALTTLPHPTTDAAATASTSASDAGVPPLTFCYFSPSGVRALAAHVATAAQAVGAVAAAAPARLTPLSMSSGVGLGPPVGGHAAAHGHLAHSHLAHGHSATAAAAAAAAANTDAHGGMMNTSASVNAIASHAVLPSPLPSPSPRSQSESGSESPVSSAAAAAAAATAAAPAAAPVSVPNSASASASASATTTATGTAATSAAAASAPVSVAVPAPSLETAAAVLALLRRARHVSIGATTARSHPLRPVRGDGAAWAGVAAAATPQGLLDVIAKAHGSSSGLGGGSGGGELERLEN